MKRNCIRIMVLLILLSPVGAIAQEEKSGGFSGMIGFGVDFMSLRPSQNEVVESGWHGGPRNRKMDSLDDRAKTYREVDAMLWGQISYEFESTGTIITSEFTPFDLDSDLSLSVTQAFDQFGVFSLEGRYNKSKVWKEPFLVGANRRTTAARELGFEIDYAAIFGTGLNLSYGFMNYDVKNDVMGDLNRRLRRDGQIHTFGAGYTFLLSENNIWTPKFDLVKGNMKGKSNSFRGGSIGLEHQGNIGKFVFETSVEYGRYGYDRKHDVFNKTRKDKVLSLTEIVTYHKLFGWENWAAYGTLSYSATDSNIKFYDRNETGIGLGIKYFF